MKIRASIILISVGLIALAACTGNNPDGTPAPVGQADTLAQPAPPPAPAAAEGMVQLHSLAGSGLKFNGTYGHRAGGIQYYMRFHERGNVVLIAGRQEPGDTVDLRSFLGQNAKSGENNVHNAPVTWRNDSLFFTTMATRGAITYAGAVEGDSVRFLKESKITGKKARIAYGFIPDPEMLTP
ncbi:MAG: hypothetical protein KDB93_09460 [Flavobacteriales bacterium]|nr:hypothetical protein [Flavobacteriales bacterium]